MTYKYWNRDWQFEVFPDSSFSDIPKDKFKSTGGYCIYLHKSLVSWKSRKSKYVCTSTSETEYVALFEAAKQGLFVAYMIEEAFEVCVFPVKLFCDNKAVVDTLRSGKPEEMTKCMATKYFKLFEWVERGLMEIERIPSAKNPADGQTKVDTKFTSL